MSRVVNDIVRQGFSGSNDDLGALRFARDTYVQCRQMGFEEGAVPSLADIEAGMPDFFKAEYEKGWYSVGTMRAWYGSYATVSRLDAIDFDYTRRQQDLRHYNRSLIYRDADSAIKLLLGYAVERNNSFTRRDNNYSYTRNRMILWVCGELQKMVMQPANAELLRQITQLEFFLERCTQDTIVREYYPESTKHKGAQGFPATLREARLKIANMKSTVKLAMEMQSLGEMFQGFGASLSTAVQHLGYFGLYYCADTAIRKGGIPFDLDEFYAHNVDSGMRVGDMKTKRGDYESGLYNSVLGRVLTKFYEEVRSIEESESGENRFLMCLQGGRESDFRQMASYVLRCRPEDLPRYDNIWGGGGYFPLDLENGERVQADEIASDIMRLFGLLVEAQKISHQFKKGKGSASFVGDYNMVYNAHMHWAMQSLLQQWRVLDNKIKELTAKMDGVRVAIRRSAPRDNTCFHNNSPVMESEYGVAKTALDSVHTDLHAIDQRIKLLHTKGYLEKKCREAKQFVVDASQSAEALLRAGILSEDDYERVERYRPQLEFDPSAEVKEAKREVGAGGAIEQKASPDFQLVVRDPMVDIALGRVEVGAAEKKEDPMTLMAGLGSMFSRLNPIRSGCSSAVIVVPEDVQHATTDKLRAFEDSLKIDEALFKARLRNAAGYMAENYAEHKQRLVASGAGLNVIFPWLAAAYKMDLAESCTVTSQLPFNAADFTVNENDGGIMLVNHTTNPVGHINFRKDVLTKAFGQKGDDFDAVCGRYALALSKEHDITQTGRFYDHTKTGKKRSLKDHYDHLQASRMFVWQNLVAVEQATMRLQRMLQAMQQVHVVPNKATGELQADWSAVDAQCARVPGHPLLDSGVSNVGDLLKRIESLLVEVDMMRKEEYQFVAKGCNAPLASTPYYSRAFSDIVTQINRAKSKASAIAGKSVEGREAVVVGDLKQQKIAQYRALRIRSVERALPPSKRMGRRFNVVSIDYQGRAQHGVRFESPIPVAEVTRLEKPKQTVINEFFSGSAFKKLMKRIHGNQTAYDRYENEYRNNAKKTSEFNYVVIGAAKAANMQAYMNVLMVRLRTALDATELDRDQAWASVYDWLGGPTGDVDFRQREQRDHFLTSDKLSFSVRLRNRSGEFNGEDTIFSALTHRHGSHGNVQASNGWFRGGSTLPATTGLLFDFVKRARSYLDEHAPKPVSNAAAAAGAG